MLPDQSLLQHLTKSPSPQRSGSVPQSETAIRASQVVYKVAYVRLNLGLDIPPYRLSRSGLHQISHIITDQG